MEHHAGVNQRYMDWLSSIGRWRRLLTKCAKKLRKLLAAKTLVAIINTG